MALFAGLGVWQVQRRTWKLALIAAVDARVHAAPAPAPGPADWPALSEEADEYRHVRVAGTWLPGHDTAVQAVTERGAGDWLMTPLRTEGGWIVLVNRGFIPPGHPAVPPLPAGPAEVTGLLRMSERPGFLRGNDPAHDSWFTRNIPQIAASRGLDDVAPYFIDAAAGPNPDALPVGGLTVVAFRNAHLVYAITWFSLSAVCVAGLAVMLRERRPAA